MPLFIVTLSKNGELTMMWYLIGLGTIAAIVWTFAKINSRGFKDETASH